MSTLLNFDDFVNESREYLKPPVGNKMVFSSGQSKVMIVGGPNERSDFHIEAGEELFYQKEGNMELVVYEKGQKRSVRIGEGELFLLPSCIPHSPQRFKDTIGLVFERERLSNEIDGLRWYTDDGRILYEESFHCTDLGTQLKPVIDRFRESDASKTGIPASDYGFSSNLIVDEEKKLMDPVNIREIAAKGENVILTGIGCPVEGLRSTEYQVELKVARDLSWESPRVLNEEVIFYQLEGSVELTIHDTDLDSTEKVLVSTGCIFLYAGGNSKTITAHWEEGCVGLAVRNIVF